jgi:hypothetical protein
MVVVVYGSSWPSLVEGESGDFSRVAAAVMVSGEDATTSCLGLVGVRLSREMLALHNLLQSGLPVHGLGTSPACLIGHPGGPWYRGHGT